MKHPITALIVILLASPAVADRLDAKFYGSYVGSGVAENLEENITELRDLNVIIEPYKNDGFRLKWITVVHNPAGRRTSEGAKHREVKENFLPVENRENVYVLAPRGGTFKKAELPNPLLGGPALWATVEEDAISVYSIAIDDTGATELQIYRRDWTEEGLDMSFLRMLNEKVLVRMTGKLVKTK